MHTRPVPIKKKLITVSEEINRAGDDQDCLVLAIVSHGDVDGKIKTNDEGVCFNQLFQIFGPNNCHVLKGKPKIILKTVRLLLIKRNVKENI